MSNQATENTQVNIHVDPLLDYSYRDMINIHAGQGDVILEFGNIHRCVDNSATISNRIVLSTHNAFELQKQLQSVLLQAQQQIQQKLNNQGR